MSDRMIFTHPMEVTVNYTDGENKEIISRARIPKALAIEKDDQYLSIWYSHFNPRKIPLDSVVSCYIALDFNPVLIEDAVNPGPMLSDLDPEKKRFHDYLKGEDTK